MLSRLRESEPSRETGACHEARSARRSLTSLARRAMAQLRLPRMVLISPLCARQWKGCARRQSGQVLVENRW